MANGSTSIYGYILPEVGADSGAWGTHLNSNFTDLDADLATLLPKAGGTMTGPLIMSDTTDASSSTTGSIKTAGGLGVAKALYVGTSVNAASFVSTGGVTASGTAGIGYATGAGGTVTQSTSKSTGVTLNKTCGTITMSNGALSLATAVSFTLTNSVIAANDLVVVTHDSGGTLGSYVVSGNTPTAGTINITVRNVSLGSLAEAIVLRFAVIKAVVA